MAATLLAGSATGAGMGVVLTNFVDEVKRTAESEQECEALQEAVDQIRPHAEKIEEQLNLRALHSLPPLIAQRIWLERLKTKIVDAQIELHSHYSGNPYLSRVNLVRNRSLAKKIGKLTTEIRQMAGNPAIQAIHSLQIETNGLLSGHIHQQTHQHVWSGSRPQFQDSSQHGYQQQTHQHGWSGSQFQDSSQHGYQQQYGHSSSDPWSHHSSPASWHDTTGSSSSASGWPPAALGSHDAWNYS